MFSIHYIRSVFGYHFWANNQLLKKAALVDKTDYFEDLGVGHGSLHTTFYHMLKTEQLWFALIKNDEKEPSVLQTRCDSLNLIQQTWKAVELNYLRYLDATAESEYSVIIKTTDQNGVETPIQRWRMLQQVLFHGAQHRAEAALILTHLGQSPGDLDFIFY
ncbi:MAG: putative damage-inducible protein DinB [Cellvibrionaceae bacterium]|jgi:uncharacterized damage-inducible protein DinB